MSTNRLTDLIGPLRRTVLQREAALWTDGQLLERYLAERDDLHFELLVERHGPMVFGLCRRLLGDSADAEDAFQATFLVLVKKAGTVRPAARVGNWLYGVAFHTARRARALSARRRLKEKEAAAMRTASPRPDPSADLADVLDQELSQLPDKYRTAIVLCDLEGRTRKEVAQHLGCPEGTVAGRLARARVLLAKRLGKRGVALSGGVLAAALADSTARAAVPAALAAGTVRAAGLAMAGKAVTGAISTQAAMLAEGVVKTMLVQKLKLVATAVLLVCALSIGAAVAYTAAAEKPDPPRSADERKPPANRDPDKGKLFDDAEVKDAGILYLEDKQLHIAADGQSVFPKNLGGNPVVYGSNGEKIVVLVHNPDANRGGPGYGRGGIAKQLDVLRVFSARTGKLERDDSLAAVDMPAPKITPQRAVVVSPDGKTCWFVALPHRADKPSENADHPALIEFDIAGQSAMPLALPKGMSETVAEPIWLGSGIGVADQRQVAKWDNTEGKFVVLFGDREDDPDARGRFDFLDGFGLVKFKRPAKKVICLTDKNLKPLERPAEYPLESQQSFGPMEYVTFLRGKPTAVAAVSTDEETRVTFVDLKTGETTSGSPISCRTTKIAPGGNGSVLMVAPDKQLIFRYDPANRHLSKLAKVNASGQWVDGVGLIGDGGEARKPAAVPEPKPAEEKGKELRSKVHVRREGRGMTFSAGLNTQMEGLALAILGSCSTSAPADKKGWQAALDGDRLLVTYSKPRLVGVGFDEKIAGQSGEIPAIEILVPLTADALPDYVWVRYEEEYRKFAKYEPHSALRLQDLVKSFRHEGEK